MACRRFWFLVYPDISKPIGGVKQIHRVAESISSCGHDVVLVQDKADFHPQWFLSSLPTTDRHHWLRTALNPATDVVVLPETFLPMLPDLKPGIPKIIFNQNGAYSFGTLGRRFVQPSQVANFYGHSDVSQVWCVSFHDRRLLTLGLGLSSQRVKLLINGLEPQFTAKGEKHLQVAYMPRKNPHDSNVVLAMLMRQPWWKGWSFQEISNCSQDQVIQHLQRSLVFLSFGHPEGFGLPVAEAMACGCAVVGYTGLGGRELFSLAAQYKAAFPVEFGDWFGCVDGIQRIHQALQYRRDDFLHQLDAMASAVRDRYSVKALRSSVLEALHSLD